MEGVTPKRNEAGEPSLQVDPRARSTEAERRVVTVVFADLSGSTALAEQLDPEDMRGVLTSFFNALSNEIHRFDGTIDKYAGDAVMAVFGAPAAHEDDPVRAVRAALAMQAAVARLNEELEGGQRVRLALRVGVNTGVVAAGVISGGAQTAYTVVGDVVNTAQRLQSIASPGEVLVGALTQRLAARWFVIDALEPRRVKGKLDAIAVFRVRHPRPDVVPRVRSALVGRATELGALLGAIDAVAEGQGRIVLVTGEAGIGKSRLLTEAVRTSGDKDVRVLEGRALAITQGISYAPFLGIVRADAAISEEEPEDDGWAKLERRAAGLFPDDVSGVLPYVATLIGLPVRGDLLERVRYLDPRSMATQIFATTRRYVARLARDRPLILIFEDWHWADASSTALLEHLLALTESEPLGICVVSRPEEPGAALARLRERALLDHYGRLLEVRLEPLPRTESEQLVRNLLEIDDVPSGVRGRIVERTGGNPFFLEEVVRALIDLGAVVRDEHSGRWRATDRIESVAIPDTVHGVITARIDHLDEKAKQVLRLASVIGRSFSYDVLRRLAEPDLALDDALAELRERDLVRERSRVPELEYTFKHALVHDAAYEGLLLQRRKELHAEVARAIETLFADRLEDFPGILAYHYARAERWEQAQEYLFKAGDRALTTAADTEALGHYREAIAAYARAFGDRWDPLQRAKVERRIGEALYRRGEHLEAREHLARCLALLGYPLPTSRRSLRFRLATALLRQVAHRAAPRLFLRRRAMPAEVREEYTQASLSVGFIDIAAGRKSTLLLNALRVLNLAEETEDTRGITVGTAGVAFICDALALKRLAGHYCALALAAAEQDGRATSLGFTQALIATHRQHALGDSAGADRAYRVALDAYRSVGDVRQWATVAVPYCQLHLFAGELADALTLAQEIASSGEDSADDQTKVWGWAMIGLCLLYAGDPKGAEKHLRRAIDLAKVVPDHLAVAATYGWLAWAALERGKIDEAIALVEEGERLAREKGLRQWRLTALRNTAVRVYLAAAEQADRTRWLRKARDASKASFAQARIDIEAWPGAYRWRGSYEWLRGRHSTARTWWDRSVAAATQLGGRIEVDLTLRERARLEETEAR